MFCYDGVVRKWHQYLVGCKFNIFTIQKSLRGLLNRTMQTLALHKWLTKLMGYDFEIHYMPDRDNKFANALSRHRADFYSHIHLHPNSFLEPPDDVTMDFIANLPAFGRKIVIWVVVVCLSKYAFLCFTNSLHAGFSRWYLILNNLKLHGVLKSIVSDLNRALYGCQSPIFIDYVDDNTRVVVIQELALEDVVLSLFEHVVKLQASMEQLTQLDTQRHKSLVSVVPVLPEQRLEDSIRISNGEWQCFNPHCQGRCGRPRQVAGQLLTNLRVFLGLTGFYNRFVHQYTALASLLMHLLKWSVFQWSPTAAATFTTLKDSMLSPLVLRLPYLPQPFNLTTDVFQVAVGAVLSQRHPIAFFNKKLGS
ncbi:Transposon Tf2-11 polyprotein [Sesamum angolense]|uniref:Transposon Tf2-11 polyprotein n=1 Tax=Sesamum angolense TaxID=2727404 RepID=A0AAE1WW17_9LAMI|nr:Transposon Tf2-11 polyprotein [Sesamum angolense]